MSEITVYQALAAVMDAVKSVAKRDRNEQQNFSFRGVDAVVNAVGPVLREHRVIVIPEVLSHTFGTVEVGKNRTPMAHVLVTARFTFYGPAGDHVSAVTMGEAMDSGDKAVPKAQSVAFRTALLQALALPTDEKDPDAEAFERTARGDLAEAKAELWRVWQDMHRGADRNEANQALQTAFAQWAGGTPLTYASEPEMRQFTDHLRQLAEQATPDTTPTTTETETSE